MTHTIRTTSLQEHQCSMCGDMIPQGTPYYRKRHTGDGGMIEINACPRCNHYHERHRERFTKFQDLMKECWPEV